MIEIEKAFFYDGDEMTAEILQGFIEKHRQNCLRYEELHRLYQGFHDILYTPDKPNFKPDNRLVANYAKYIVDTFNGYFMGIPVKTSHDEEAVSAFIQAFESRMDIDDLNAEISKKTSIFGHCYELLYTDEDGQVGSAYIEPSEAFIIYDMSIRERPLYGVRYQMMEHGARGSISDEEKIIYFDTDDKGKIVFEDEEVDHYFGEVPLIEYVENEERQGAFENVETLINAYNKAISEKANDVDYFADAYMKILGSLVDRETLESIRDNRIINMRAPDTTNLVVEFMDKPDGDETQENLINRLEMLIFNISMVANINDKDFGASSGIALRYKLQSMSNLANTKERKFTKGFRRRYRLIAGLVNTPIYPEDVYGLNFMYTRNTPANLLEEAQTANLLTNLVSDETALNTLSVVGDVKAELERIKDEAAPLPLYDEDFER